MEILLMILMMLVVFNCAMKISLWPFWARLAFALLLGVFAYWSIDYAVMQSKTQIDSWLHREDVLQGIAIMVTVESAIGLMFCLSYLNDDGKIAAGLDRHQLMGDMHTHDFDFVILNADPVIGPVFIPRFKLDNQIDGFADRNRPDPVHGFHVDDTDSADFHQVTDLFRTGSDQAVV